VKRTVFDKPAAINVQEKIRDRFPFRSGTIYRAATKDYLNVYRILLLPFANRLLDVLAFFTLEQQVIPPFLAGDL
jgi:hypothetical protein